MSCEEFQNLPEEERDASDITLHRLAQNKRWKRCQRRMIELTHGCYHMTCLHNNQLTSLSPCLDYIRGNASTPPSCCCSQLAFLVKSQPQCLCEAVNGDASSIAASLNINQTRAFTLPSACNVHTPPISTCSGSTIFFSNWCFCFQLSKFPFSIIR
ncbi:Bifunctional inhibitor/plant lipid transfer protein/seed storage helical domain [Sesbania bispinosa]|nr:Bifunctional inhibitor/plant lipid transfer protein/seed storage helical domain [Sesbania bispinosa]